MSSNNKLVIKIASKKSRSVQDVAKVVGVISSGDFLVYFIIRGVYPLATWTQSSSHVCNWQLQIH